MPGRSIDMVRPLALVVGVGLGIGCRSSAPHHDAPRRAVTAVAVARTPHAVRLQDIRAGRASIADLIDVDAGVVIRDRSGTYRVCGVALPLVIEALDGALSTGTEPTCDRAACFFQVPAPIGTDEPNVAISFAGDSQRIEAVVWKAQVIRDDLGQALGAAGPVCPPDAGGSGTATPAGSGGSAVTRAWMRQIADGTVAAAELIEAAHGLVVVVYRGEAEPPDAMSSERLCGAAAIRELERRRPALRANIEAGDHDEGTFRCSNRPAPTCSIGAWGEGMTTSRLLFRSAGTALVLDTIIDVDSVYAPIDQAPVLARLRARQLGGDCTP